MSELESAINKLKSEGYSSGDIQNALVSMMSNEPPVKYPRNFHSFEGGVKVSSEKVNKWIKEMVEDLDTNEHIDYRSIATGDAHVHIRRVEGLDVEYEITVSKKYWQAFI